MASSDDAITTAVACGRGWPGSGSAMRPTPADLLDVVFLAMAPPVRAASATSGSPRDAPPGLFEPTSSTASLDPGGLPQSWAWSGSRLRLAGLWALGAVGGCTAAGRRVVVHSGAAHSLPSRVAWLCQVSRPHVPYLRSTCLGFRSCRGGIIYSNRQHSGTPCTCLPPRRSVRMAWAQALQVGPFCAG